MDFEREICLRSPNQCSQEQLDRFESLVLAGGEVESVGLRRRIENAELLGFCLVDGELVSVAAVKNPAIEYHSRVFTKCGKPKAKSQYPLEYGWAHTVQRHRRSGHSTALAVQLLAALEPQGIFATARIGNESIRGMLHKLDFQEIGVPYPGREEPIQVFVRSQLKGPAFSDAD